MGGLYQSSDAERERVIDSWMRATIGDGGVDRYDDLHVDRIDPSWRHRSRWIPAALCSLELAVKIRDRNNYPFTVAVAFSLQSGEGRRGVDFRTSDEIEAQLNHTPPSLYLFHPGTEPWARAKGGVFARDIVIEEMDTAIFGAKAGATACFYIEFGNLQAGGYFRSVFLAV